ncbi:VOC family protein [Hoeflea poritis]|uniref:VOC family protein n=1 Tax=Hoeflea poritis TaxID=2993659 RepID=A0ABT4VUQ2_9HYPH|nr:VOC family protein [Hoeflea poritis]MDA4848448.1 VOC family protein [Hoeflea poritis]
MTTEKAGHIVWHDLFTPDKERSMAFFERIAEWAFVTERATDFAWGGGERDFVLALRDNEAGAGFAETPEGVPSGWIAYVEVPDVDAAAARAETSGGTIVRQPFEVPGVGRNALLRDPLGALFGISLSRHSYPVPRRQFGIEIYVSGAAAFPAAFYAQVLGWNAESAAAATPTAGMITGPSGEAVAVHLSGVAAPDAPARWTPRVRVSKPDKARRLAEDLGAVCLKGPVAEAAAEFGFFMQDPVGAYFWLTRSEGEAP